MNLLPLTSFFAGFLSLFYLFLSFRIGYLRGSPAMKIILKKTEETSDFTLTRNIRAHGNFSEYVPIFLILLMINEILGKSSFEYLMIICIVFTYGRIAHGICFAFYDSSPFLRMTGMICTYLALTAFSIQLFIMGANSIFYSITN